jgi:hypothetical protein
VTRACVLVADGAPNIGSLHILVLVLLCSVYIYLYNHQQRKKEALVLFFRTIVVSEEPTTEL